MGYCMGGALTIAAAVHVPEFAAGVAFYGIPPKEFAEPAKIRVPLQGHFANQDDWCTPAAVNDLERALREAGVKHEILSLPCGARFRQRAQRCLRRRLRQSRLGAPGRFPAGPTSLAARSIAPSSDQKQHTETGCEHIWTVF